MQKKRKSFGNEKEKNVQQDLWESGKFSDIFFVGV